MATPLPRWTGGSGIPVTVDAAGNVTANAQSVSVLFDSFTITPPTRAGQSTTHTVAFCLVLDAAKPVHLGIAHHLRGRVIKGAESRIVVTAALGPSLVTREFPYGEPYDDGFLIEHQDDFVQAPRQPFTGIVTVLIKQRERDVPVLVAVDSIDATVASADV